MGPQRRIFLLPTLLVAAGLLWLAQHWVREMSGTRRLAAGRWYAVEAAAEAASLDLSFEPGERYLLVISSLGSPADKHRVTLTSESTVARLPLGVRPLKSLPEQTPRQHHGTAEAERTPVPPDTQQPTHSTREFYLHVTEGALENPNSYVRVNCRCVAQGQHVRVFLDRQVQPGQLSPGLVDEIVHVMDTETMPAMSERLGTYYDVDGDGKFAIVLSPWLGRLQGGQTSLGGFVRSSDFRSELEAPFSNRCDVMYLNSSLTTGKHLRTLLAHEYTHAVCCSQRLACRTPLQRLPEEEDWLNEAIAHLAENLYADGWSNLDHRVNVFLNEPNAYPLIVSDYYRAGLWRNHGCRGATYLFLRWCVDQFGEECLSRLIRSSATGTRNLEMALGVPFEELFRRWSIALTPDENNDIPDAYESLDLRGELGKWSLAGPKVEEWDVDGATTRHLDLVGTSTAFVMLHAGVESEGLHRIQLTAEYGTRLQISVQKQTKRQPGLDLEARWSTAANSSSASDQNEDVQPVRVELAMNPPADFQVECVTFEELGPHPKRQLRFQGSELEVSEIESQNSDSPAMRQFVVPLTRPNNLQKGCIIKVAVRDSRGRRSTARRTLGAADEWLSQFAFAETEATRRRQ